MIKTSTLAAVLLIVLQLNACGWHLRGNSESSSGLHIINLEAADRFTPLFSEFQKEIERRQIIISNDASTETGVQAPTLTLLGEKIESRVMSLNTELDPAVNELSLTIRYQINGIAYQQLSRQNWNRDKNRIAAQENARDIHIQKMRKEIAGRILRQVELIHSNTVQANNSK